MEIKLKAGKKYSICSCGLSGSLPFCDNTHREFNSANGTEYKSVKIIFPSRNAHGTIRTFSSKKTSISQGAKLVLGGALKKNPARRLKFLEQIQIQFLNMILGMLKLVMQKIVDSIHGRISESKLMYF